MRPVQVKRKLTTQPIHLEHTHRYPPGPKLVVTKGTALPSQAPTGATPVSIKRPQVVTKTDSKYQTTTNQAHRDPVHLFKVTTTPRTKHKLLQSETSSRINTCTCTVNYRCVVQFYLLSSYFMSDTTISEMSMASVFQINNSTAEKQNESFVSV